MMLKHMTGTTGKKWAIREIETLRCRIQENALVSESMTKTRIES